MDDLDIWRWMIMAGSCPLSIHRTPLTLQARLMEVLGCGTKHSRIIDGNTTRRGIAYYFYVLYYFLDPASILVIKLAEFGLIIFRWRIICAVVLKCSVVVSVCAILHG